MWRVIASIHWIYCIIAVGIAIPTSARAEGRAPRVGIVAAVHVNVSVEDSDQIADELGSALAAELVVDAIAGPDANRRLPDGRMPEGCVASPECIRDVAQRLEADQLLMLAIVKLGDRIQIDPMWSDAAADRTVSREAIVIASDDDRTQLFAEAAVGLLPDAVVRQPVQPAAASPSPAPMPAPIVLPAPEGGRRMTRGVWIAGGVTAAALVGAVSFSIATKRADNRLQRNDCETQPCDSALVDSLEHRALAADLFLGAAVAAGVTAGVLYYLSDRDDEEISVHAGALPSGAGVVVKGAF